jgi:hypothetical protein
VAAEAAPATTGQPYGRVFNFSAGPAILPVDVLEQAQADLLNWRGSGWVGWRELGGSGLQMQRIRVPGAGGACSSPACTRAHLHARLAPPGFLLPPLPLSLTSSP